ncbi:tellurite resistance TerB family protein [Planktotalea arctica]|uniref:tellurite resistance TerB family protein n=1 Tax=Planktotalea arctica TaxID=1481893 RepID=UPI000A1771E2|nr:tellurite resistance TerB family protein [Planktotalea arctica]
MSLMGTLAKVAIGYATARGVEKMSGGGGLSALLGGGSAAETGSDANPMAAMMQQMMGGGANEANAGNPMADMMAKMTGSAAGATNPMAEMMAQFTGGGVATDKGGLLSSAGTTGGAGLAGLFAAMGGAAAMGGKGVGDMLDCFGKAAPGTPEVEQSAGLMLRAMIQAAKCDGDIDAAERAKILETVGDDADAEDMAFIQAQLSAPVDVETLTADTPDAQKFQVYAMSMMSIRVDTPAEKAYMAALADALGIDPQTALMLNMQMGVNA